MKKLLLIAFIAITTIGCSKDEETTPTISLVGTWKVDSYKAEFYTASGVKDYEEVYTNDPDAMDKVVFTASTATITDNSGSIETSAYTLSKMGGKNYLHFVNPSISDDDEIEITTATSTTLTLLGETPNVSYVKNGQTKTAANVQVKIVFTKQ